jgi:hypothetical protein
VQNQRQFHDFLSIATRFMAREIKQLRLMNCVKVARNVSFSSLESSAIAICILCCFMAFVEIINGVCAGEK